MRKTTVYAATATLSILSGASLTALAKQSAKPSPPPQGKAAPKGVLVIASKEFIRLFAGYGAAVQSEGVAGVKSFAGSIFVLRSKGARPLTGDAAFKELTWYDDAKGLDYGITVSRLVTTGDTFTAFVSESIAIRDIPKTENNADLHVTSGTATWFWKQTWRKTPSGWKLAVWEQVDNKPSGFSFTIKIPASKPAEKSP